MNILTTNDNISRIFVFSGTNWSFKSKRALKFLITNPIGKTLVILVYIVYLSLSIWSSSQLREGIEIKDLVARDSHYNLFMHDNTEMSNLDPIVMFVITEPIDYDNMTNRAEISRVLSQAMDLPEMSKTFSLSWLSIYNEQKIRYKFNPKKLKEDLAFMPQFRNDIVLTRKQSNTTSDKDG